MFRLNRYLLVFVLFIGLFTLASIAAQETTPPVEPPTEAPTLEPPTAEPPTLEPPTAEPPTLELPTLESPTLSATLIPTETVTAIPTLVDTVTLIPTDDVTLPPTPLISDSVNFEAVQATPGALNYGEILQEWQATQENAIQSQNSLLSGCATYITPSFAVVGQSGSGLPAIDFYAAVAQAHLVGAASPYPIYLCEGTFPLHETIVLQTSINIYGRGTIYDVSVITQMNTTTMGGMFTVNNGVRLEFHNVLVHGGRAERPTVGSTRGGVVMIWEGSLGIYDSRFEDNRATNYGGVAFGNSITHSSITIERSIIHDNRAGSIGGAFSTQNTLDATCVQFSSNRTIAGGSSAGAFYARNGTVTNSAFLNNTSTSTANHISNSINAANNYWLTIPQRPRDIANAVIDSPRLTINPIGTTICTPHPAVPLPNVPPPTSIPTMTPLPTQTPSVPTLADYGVALVEPTDWNPTETDALLNAFLRVGQALQSQYGGISPQEAFTRVMYGSGRSQIQLIRSSSIAYCLTDNNVSPPLQSTITCNPSLIITEYTIVHELGHVFVGRTGGHYTTDPNATPTNTPTYFYLNNFATVVDHNAMIVYGYSPSTNSWDRRDRGWGSSSPLISSNQACDFQQNPLKEVGITSDEVDEGAADMFLNWVYQELNLDGFKNIDWEGYTVCSVSGNTDTTNPGDERYLWMEGIMEQLGNAREW